MLPASLPIMLRDILMRSHACICEAEVLIMCTDVYLYFHAFLGNNLFFLNANIPLPLLLHHTHTHTQHSQVFWNTSDFAFSNVTLTSLAKYGNRRHRYAPS